MLKLLLSPILFLTAQLFLYAFSKIIRDAYKTTTTSARCFSYVNKSDGEDKNKIVTATVNQATSIFLKKSDIALFVFDFTLFSSSATYATSAIMQPHQSSMRIAILGGSFDPPHLGHLLVAGQIKKNLNIDQVWLMPAFIHPLHKQLTRAKDRMRMTKLLEGDGILASDFEIRQNKKSYTIETMRLLSAKYPNDTFFWISGSDQIKNYPKWKEWRKILENYNVIIYSRGDSKAEIEEELKKILQTKTVPNNFFILASSDLPVIDVSSTAVRQRIKEKLPIKSLVPKKVEGYIIEHKLYK